MPSDGVTNLRFLLRGIFYAIPWARPGYLKNPGHLTYCRNSLPEKCHVTWLPKQFSCTTHSKVGHSRILIGNPMALHIWKFQVHSDFVSMPSFMARWCAAMLNRAGGFWANCNITASVLHKSHSGPLRHRSRHECSRSVPACGAATSAVPGSHEWQPACPVAFRASK